MFNMATALFTYYEIKVLYLANNSTTDVQILDSHYKCLALTKIVTMPPSNFYLQIYFKKRLDIYH